MNNSTNLVQEAVTIRKYVLILIQCLYQLMMPFLGSYMIPCES